MNNLVRQCVEIIRQKTDFVPSIAIVLGSGLGDFAMTVDKVAEVSYEELPDFFPISTVENHEGKFVMGYVSGVPVICMQGRVHYYEGYTPDQVVMPIRVMRELGAEVLIVSNAAGGIKDTYRPGTLALITDHVALFVPNPLQGPNDPEYGLRFPDMTSIYDRRLRRIIQDAAFSSRVILDQGVYVQLPGPSFETPAEIRMLERLGIDLVGMSTCMETIVANYLGMKVCGISLVTNYAAGISAYPITQEEVDTEGKKAAESFKQLMMESVAKIYEYTQSEKDLSSNA